MYNPFTSVKVAPAYSTGHFVYWSIDPVFSDALPHNFIVEVSGTPDFSEILYTIQSGDAFSVVDPNLNFKQSLNIDLFYRVRLVTGDNNEYLSKTVAFSVSNYNRREYVMAREIARKELLRIRKYTGRSMWLLKRKIYGTKVTDNTVDQVTGIPLTNQTPNLTNNIQDGYYKPLGLYCSIEDMSSARLNNPEGMGLDEVIHQRFRTLGFPIIQTYDIIVDANNDARYNVKAVESFEFPSTDIILVQIIDTQLIPNTDPVYKVAIPNVPML